MIADGIRPRAVIVFFRDTNLTNVLFRIDATWSLDTAALDREDDLNAVVARRRGTMFYQVRDRFDRLYEAEQARRWIEPAITGWPAAAMISSPLKRAAFTQELNDRFGLTHVRPMDAADMQATEDREADFDAFVDKSGLPLMLRDARQAGLTLVLVRVQRRPAGGQPPRQSPALQRYVAKLQAYIEANGAIFIDDTGDRPRRSTCTRTATTCHVRAAAATRRPSPPGCASACRDLSQPRLRRLLSRRHCRLLAAAAPRRRTCCCSARATSSTAGSIPGSCS